MNATRAARPDRLTAHALALAAALILVACSKVGRSPAEPLVRLPTSWSATWTFDEAAPAGDCLVDALNAYDSDHDATVHVWAEAGSIELQFEYPGDTDSSEGFWPIAFAGTIDAQGGVHASVTPAWVGSRRTDPYLDLCYAEWTTLGGELRGRMSEDGTGLTGSVVENFRALPNGKVFTIRSHFEAVRR